jgi:hypothetical protein
MSVVTFRDTIRRISPPWLRNGEAEKLMYALGIHADIVADSLVEAVKRRLPRPGFGNLWDTLPQLGRERRIVRGQTESDEAYANRLARWLPDHRRRGNPYAMLEQIYGYFTGNHFPIDLVAQNGVRHKMDTSGNIVRDVYNWGHFTPREDWAKWWLIYYTDTADYDDDWLRVPREWNAAHCIGTLVVLGNGRLWNYPEPVPEWDLGAWSDGDPPLVKEI